MFTPIPSLLLRSTIYPHRNSEILHYAFDTAHLILTMSALLEAPEELLDAITTHLGQADVLSLARTCKALWHSTSPRIFRAISMT